MVMSDPPRGLVLSTCRTPPSHPSYLSPPSRTQKKTAQHRAAGGGPAGLLGGGGAGHRAGGGRGGQALLGGERADHLPIRGLTGGGGLGWGEGGDGRGGGVRSRSLFFPSVFFLRGPSLCIGRGGRRDCMCKIWGKEAARAFFLGGARARESPPLPVSFLVGGGGSLSIEVHSWGQGAGGHRVGLGDTGRPRFAFAPTFV